MRSQFRLRLLTSSLLIGAAALSAPAFAQDTAADPAAEAQDEATGEPELVVTGSLISNPNLERSAPVNVTTADEIELLQSNTAEEILRDLPGVVASIGNAVNNGNGGASFVDLRGLGSNRNIVLLDGVRITPAGLVGQVDLNNIPLALVERVDALTGAASTTYGADAITGVVNFITKQDFAGIELSAGQSITERGDGNTFRVDATIGANFDDGRGNAVFSIGYQEADPVFQGDRKFSLESIDSFTGGSGGSGTATPSRFSGSRPIDPVTGLPSTNPAVANATLQLNPGATALVSPYLPFNFNPFNILQTPFERFNMFGQARYEVSDQIEVYTRGLFSKNTVNTIIAPSGVFNSAVQVNLNNPFLPANVRAQFCATDIDTSAAGYTPRFDPATCAAAALATGPSDPRYRVVGRSAVVPFDVNGDGVIAAGETRETNPAINLARRTPEVGPRISNFQTTIFDYRLGARGGITDNIDYDVFGAYGESENTQTLQGYVLTSRVRQALLANGTVAAPVCQDTSNGCVPLNIFGPIGSLNADSVPFISAESTTTVRTSLAQARATISGDFGFSSPLAEESVGFAVGGEYRRYSAQQRSDSLAQQAGELGGAGGAAPNIDGGYDVYEAFGEIVVPLIENRPFFESLTFEAGIRYSDYSIEGAGRGYSTTTYKAGGSWEPGAGVKVRGNYSRAVRAPNINELFSPVNTVLTNLSNDPCASVMANGTRFRPAPTGTLRDICLGQGANAGNVSNIVPPTAGQANITTGGNLNLNPEKSDSYTIGVVLQPDFLPGFSASLDYYNIKIEDAITVPLSDDLISACFDAGTAPTDPICTQIRRNPSTGGLDGDPATTGGLFGVFTNQGRLFTDGIDLALSYRTDVTDNIGLSLNFTGNYTFNQKFNANVFLAEEDQINRECVGFYSTNCGFTGSLQPEFQWSQRTTVSFGDDIDVSVLWRHIDSMQQEPLDILSGNGPGFQGTLPAGALGVGGRTVDFQKVEAYDYFDLAGRFGVLDNFTFTVTVQNLFDKQPPLLGSTIGTTTYNSGNTFPSTYDSLGRRFAVGARLTF